jgi:hypothetical protein
MVGVVLRKVNKKVKVNNEYIDYNVSSIIARCNPNQHHELAWERPAVPKIAFK